MKETAWSTKVWPMGRESLHPPSSSRGHGAGAAIKLGMLLPNIIVGPELLTYTSALPISGQGWGWGWDPREKCLE